MGDDSKWAISSPGSITITADYAPEHTKPEIGSFEVKPTPFSPNDDDVNDDTTISYIPSDNLSSALRVRVEIRDSSDRIVKTLIDAESQSTGRVQSASRRISG